MPKHVLDESSLAPHVASCPWCLPRVERALNLWRARQRFPTDVGKAPIGAIRYAAMASPLGVLWMARSERGLVGVSCTSDEASFCQDVDRYGSPWYDPTALKPIADQLQAYFAGKRALFGLPLDLRRCTPFQRQVLDAVAEIPYGAVRSYAEIADRIGAPRAARAVGTAIAGNPVSLVVPCHRVIRSDGQPGEYARTTLGACGIAYKLDLLSLEGCSPSGGLFGTMASRRHPMPESD